MPEDIIRGFHYTNTEAFEYIRNGGYWSGPNKEYKGLVPSRRFIRLGRRIDLPEKAHDDVIEGLLDPEPDSWMRQEQFPQLWRYLMGDIVRQRRTMLLSFDIQPNDEAFVVDRAHIERELYKGKEKSTRESVSEACWNYWNSRIPALEYEGGHVLPQLAIWTPVPFERLNVEWTRAGDEFWQECLEKSRLSVTF